MFLYAAIAFGLKKKITIEDINGVNVKKFSDRFVIDENVNIILDELPDEWIESSLLGANKLVDEKFQSKGLSNFYIIRIKQSILINDIFSRVKKLEKFRKDINNMESF